MIIEEREIMNTPCGTVIMDEDGEGGKFLEAFMISASTEYARVIFDFEGGKVRCIPKQGA